MKIIDTHTHIFPNKIALKAACNIGKFYDLPMKCDGTVAALLEVCEQSHVDKCVVQSVATSPAQVESINSYVSSQVNEHPDRFIGFATLHPDCVNIPAIIDEVIAKGLVGIKLHPDFQRFNIDDDRAMKIFEAVEGRLPVLIHAGDFRTQFSKPFRIANMMRAFPKLDVIAAHMGGWSEWGESAAQLADLGVYVDTSSTLALIPTQKARELMDIFDNTHILFGSDYPMWSAADERVLIERLFADENEKERIYHLNFESLMRKYGHEV